MINIKDYIKKESFERNIQFQKDKLRELKKLYMETVNKITTTEINLKKLETEQMEFLKLYEEV